MGLIRLGLKFAYALLVAEFAKKNLEIHNLTKTDLILHIFISNGSDLVEKKLYIYYV